MKTIQFSDAEAPESSPGWTRLAVAQAEHFSTGYFYRTAGRKSAPHHHHSEQLSIVIQSHLRVVGSDGKEFILGPGDSVYFAPNEMHQIEHAGTGNAIGIDVFSPARSCDLWMTR
jgi:quercetin dioxygenase-like cupin family protein